MKEIIALALFGFPLALGAQPRNLNFHDGTLGWSVAQPVDETYSIEARHDQCHTRACILLSASQSSPAQSGSVTQTFAADSYRGKTVRFAAWLRVESDDPLAHASVWIRTGPEARPGTDVSGSRWKVSEILYDVEPDASIVSIGVRFTGAGRVWIDDAAFVLRGIETDLSHNRPRNLDFRIGGLGRLPAGWKLEPGSDGRSHSGYRGSAVRSGCLSGPMCAVLTSPTPLPKPAFASLMQTFAAESYRGKWVRVRASLRRGTSNAASSAHLWLRVDDDQAPQEPSAWWFADNRMEICKARPLDWTDCEVIQRVGDQAESISFGFTINWRGPVWIDRVSFDTVSDASAFTPSREPVGRLVARVRQAVEQRQTDELLAKSLHDFKLSERLEDRVIEELQSEGSRTLGPQAVTELMNLRDATAQLTPPSQLPFAMPPAPPIEEQRAVINRAGEYAFKYAARLPDFLCTQTVRRSEDRDGKGWKPIDVLGLQVGYFDNTEHYRLDTVNRRRTKVDYESVKGASSQGELGSMMVEILRVGVAKFAFDHWTTLRGRRAYVFRFSVPVSKSNYSLEFGDLRRHPASAVIGQHGYLYLETESASVLRIVRFSDDIPADFPIEDASTTLDYDYFDVAGERYLLPLNADVRMERGGVGLRNDIVFGDYRKFTGESKISFQ